MEGKFSNCFGCSKEYFQMLSANLSFSLFNGFYYILIGSPSWVWLWLSNVFIHVYILSYSSNPVILKGVSISRHTALFVVHLSISFDFLQTHLNNQSPHSHIYPLVNLLFGWELLYICFSPPCMPTHFCPQLTPYQSLINIWEPLMEIEL